MVVDIVTVANQGEQMNDLYRRCPDCDGVGSFSVMSGDPDMHETEYECERCRFTKGYVKVEPTDRICDEHGELTHAGATACEGGEDPTFHWWDDCKMVDVVRVTDV